ncbi:pimeloyl-ACP methyl ester carboxylesterase [Actinocrispum wychmicini]|uniref:Pimeloyl-ACP methyl ester carboxylesterase n=2 Tax=Actinocrispum wychmicini TaxID=1213861 RepID=A0A4V6NNS1_9PSEU|nr:pimeloyl-ACP methyl ester carboxylesterase [Actinocrispum wychmicini]
MQRELAFRGHRSLAVDLPGRGAGFSAAYYQQNLAVFAAEPSPTADITAADTIGHVVDTIRRVREHGPVILVGHSLGGMAISGAGNEIPELIDRIVYIAAIVPVRPATEYLPEYLKGGFLPAVAPLHVGDPAKQGHVRVNWRGATPDVLFALKAVVNPEASDAGWLATMAGNQPDETLGQWDPGYGTVGADTWGRIPRTFLKTVDDKACPPAVQDMFIEEGDALTPDNPWDVRPIRSSHGGFLTNSTEVADILAGLGV